MYGGDEEGVGGIPRHRWVKENSGAGNGFPPLPTATSLSLLAFPDGRDPAGSLTSSEGREREERPTQSCVDLDRVRECVESNYKR
jgi:hypothetical protein